MTSSFFTLERRVRQGDPLSPYLFVVAVETLAIAIRQSSDIKGIYIEEQETKLLQYADTMAILADTNSAKVLQWNPVNMDTNGTCPSVRINGVSVLSGLSEKTLQTHVLSKKRA